MFSNIRKLQRRERLIGLIVMGIFPLAYITQAHGVNCIVGIYPETVGSAKVCEYVPIEGIPQADPRLNWYTVKDCYDAAVKAKGAPANGPKKNWELFSDNQNCGDMSEWSCVSCEQWRDGKIPPKPLQKGKAGGGQVL